MGECRQNGRLFWRVIGTLLPQCEGKTIFYRVVTAFCIIVFTILQNTLYTSCSSSSDMENKLFPNGVYLMIESHFVFSGGYACLRA
eukprot:6202397-Pleurochrysis_carterae.AAC.1